MKKVISFLLCAVILFSLSGICASAQLVGKTYTITDPYKDVEKYLGNKDNHYKTNLHTHSTVSDASVTLPEIVKGYYEENFDILAVTDHGVYGKAWNEQPTRYWLMRICTIFNALADKADYDKHQYDTLTDEEFEAITNGTYEFSNNGQTFTPSMNLTFSETSNRTYKRGMYCLKQGAELSAASIMQSHLNGFFSDFGEKNAAMLAHEGDYEYFIKGVEEDGGVTFINHPGHYLNAKHIPENNYDVNQLFYFSDLFIRYKSCLGIETFNNNENESRYNRLFWDNLLQYTIPYGKNVWGFSNSDAHSLRHIDTEFMDFILPSVSDATIRSAMEKGEFFATGRLAKPANELGDGFKASGPVPQVTSIVVDDDNDTITITADNAKRIEWVANGVVIESQKQDENGTMTSVIRLREHSDDITCYVRFQIFGDGGYCYSNAFVCDDGNMDAVKIIDTRTESEKKADAADRRFSQSLIGALIKVIKWSIANDKV